MTGDYQMVDPAPVLRRNPPMEPTLYPSHWRCCSLIRSIHGHFLARSDERFRLPASITVLVATLPVSVALAVVAILAI